MRVPLARHEHLFVYVLSYRGSSAPGILGCGSDRRGGECAIRS
jgi:hypothetical protein